MNLGRPAGIPASAYRLWDEGAYREEVCAGDLWVLSWDGDVVGLALIAAVKRGFVLAWPVTLPGEASFSPGLVISDSPLGVPVTLWATRETGIGHHLLDRSLGQLLAPDQIRPLALALDDGAEPGFIFASGSASENENVEADRLMVDHWTELCFNAGGAENGLFLDSENVKVAGGSAKMIGEVLAFGPQDVRPLMTGEVPITEDQLDAIAERLGADPTSLTGPDPLADVVADLANPRFKAQVLVRVAETGIDERTIRRSARREFALVARNDGDLLRESKLRDAINRAGRGAF